MAQLYTSDILIQNGKVVRPGMSTTVANILIRSGTISGIRRGLKTSAQCEVIDAKGKLVCPGFIDLHTHLREPGFEYKETIQTGSAAAVAGGFTSICCMPNTNPVNDNKAVTEFILEKSRLAGLARVLPIGAITARLAGDELAVIGELASSGCVALSDDGHPVSGSLIMRRAMEYAKALGLTIVDHCEDRELSKHGVMHEGEVSTTLGLLGIPSAAEDVIVARDIALAEMTGCRLHLAHVSTSGAVRLVREAKARGVSITAEACPHHFILTDEAVGDFDTHAKVNPPLRAESDVQAIRAGLADGTIEVIATDHAPHASEEKEQEFDRAPFGISGLETALGLTLSLVEDGILDLESAIRALTSNPAKAFGLDGGDLREGGKADITIVDPNEEWEVDPSTFRSKGRNTPFAGRMLKGKVVTTIVGGKVVFSTNKDI
tara:strand:+ start:7789 stop:9090 length:1302 start_codon:yes stop_codon:yes gene_type:complete